MFLTKSGGFIVKPISILLGYVINGIYNLLCSVGIENVGITIILFTIIVKLCIFPTSIKATKSGKINSYIQPEIDKVMKKYRGKKDQQSMMAMQNESRAIREKYGASATGGCLPMLLQFPIIFALYRVAMNIPAYISKVKDMYQPIADALFENKEALNKLVEYHDQETNLKNVKLIVDNKDSIIDVLAKFSNSNWTDFCNSLDNKGIVVDAINGNLHHINKAYTLFGDINITNIYGLTLSVAIIIPILACVFQILVTLLSPAPVSDDPTQQQTANMMRKMSIGMSIFYFFICAMSPLSFGLYFATTAFFALVSSLLTNLYFKKCDMEKIVNKSMEKAAKKAAKRKASGKKSFMERMQEAANGNLPEQNSNTSRNISKNISNASLKNYESKNTNTQYRPGSLASKANVMQRYNDSNNGGKK